MQHDAPPHQAERPWQHLLLSQQLVALGGDDLLLRSGCDELSELRRDALERDERRLAELGRRTVEMYALAHIFTEVLEVSQGP